MKQQWKTKWHGGYGHPQSYEARRKIGRSKQEVWIIERLSQYTGRGIIEFSCGELWDCDGLSPRTRKRKVRLPSGGVVTLIRCDIPAERSFLRVANLRSFCRNEGLDYRNLRRTLDKGGWCTDHGLLSGDEWANVASKYAVRACLKEEGQYYELPCERHAHCGHQPNCRGCTSYATWPYGKPVRIEYSDSETELVHAYGGTYRRLHPPRD